MYSYLYMLAIYFEPLGCPHLDCEAVTDCHAGGRPENVQFF
jgi:hypothetical protein